jgi:hypothetical protein
VRRQVSVPRQRCIHMGGTYNSLVVRGLKTLRHGMGRQYLFCNWIITTIEPVLDVLVRHFAFLRQLVAANEERISIILVSIVGKAYR